METLATGICLNDRGVVKCNRVIPFSKTSQFPYFNAVAACFHLHACNVQVFENSNVAWTSGRLGSNEKFRLILVGKRAHGEKLSSNSLPERNPVQRLLS